METGIQANFRAGEDLINVYGPNGPEFDANLAHAMARADQIAAAGRALRSGQAVGLVEQELGGEVIAEYETPPTPPPPAQPAWPQPAYTQAQPQQTYCGRCMQAPVCKTCNQPAKVEVRSVKNGQYWIHDCPSGNRDHKGQWCNTPK